MGHDLISGDVWRGRGESSLYPANLLKKPYKKVQETEEDLKTKIIETQSLRREEWQQLLSDPKGDKITNLKICLTYTRLMIPLT